MTEAADVIVIATMLSSKGGFYNLYRGDLLQQLDEDSVDIYVTQFRVIAKLKGSVVGDVIEIVHVVRRKNGLDLSNNHFATFAPKKTLPVYVEVEVDGETLAFSAPTGTRNIVPEYLLFLTSRDDNRYELVSGDKNGASSVRIVNLE